MKTIIFSLFALHFSLAAIAQNLYFPPNNGQWATVTTSDLNWCTPELNDLQQFLDTKNSKAFIILKDGKIAVEWYFDAFTQDSLWYWASAGKTLTATLVGIAQEEGLLNIQQPAAQYLGSGWTDCTPLQEQQITILNQLTMTTGLDDGVPDDYCTLDTCLQYLAPPNTRWAYHNAPYTLLDKVLINASGMNFNNFVFSRLTSKIGANIVFLPVGYNNLAVSKARDMARFGLLTLAKGNWNGTAVYSDTTYFNAMLRPSQSLNPSYGYLWWLNGQQSHMLPTVQFQFSGALIPNAPTDMVAALGKNDQKIYVVPSQNLVVIRMGNDAGDGQLASSSFDNQLWEKINALDCLTATQKPQETPKFRLFPNPTQGEMQTEGAEKVARLQIFDAQGKLIKTFSEVGAVLNLNDLPDGWFVYRYLLHDGTIGRERFFKY